MLSLLVVTAGCTTVGSPNTETIASHTTTDTEQHTTTTTATATETPTPTATAYSTPIRTLPYDLRINNYGNETRTLNVTVIHNGTGETLLNERLTVDPDESPRKNLSFRDPGNYTVRVTTDGETYTYVWEVENTPPDSHILVNIRQDGIYISQGIP